jgi:hypothetical protein
MLHDFALFKLEEVTERQIDATAGWWKLPPSWKRQGKPFQAG